MKTPKFVFMADENSCTISESDLSLIFEAAKESIPNVEIRDVRMLLLPLRFQWVASAHATEVARKYLDQWARFIEGDARN